MCKVISQRLRALWVPALASALIAVAGCAHRATAPTEELAFDDAVNAAIDDLFSQTQKLKLPAFVAQLESKLTKKGLVIDPVIEAGSGSQTTATRVIDTRVAERATAKFPGIETLSYRADNVAKASYLLTGAIARSAAAGAGSEAGGYRIELSLTDLKTGSIVAHSSANARAAGVDMTPTPYYRDSPVLVKDKIIEGSIATAKGSVGQTANRAYFDSVGVGAVVIDATNAYNDGRAEDALALYQKALAMPGGDQIRVHNGIYLANWRLGRLGEAEQAFGRVVATGIANRSLGVKFLFKPDSTDFWPDPKVTNVYDSWLRQIARQIAASKLCLHVVGHTSRTGSPVYNDQLSQRRAQHIKQRLESETAELDRRIRASGMGFRENIVGTGTDDVRDSLDRRVEFRIDDC
jgi:outer membrane protein OmpA-like peptidoglycan-associated protein